MQHRRLGKTDLKVSAVALGALEIGAKYGIGEECGQVPTHEEASELMLAAIDAGVTLFDTAGIYGLSEKRIGALPKPARDQLTLTTKLNITKGDDGKWLDYATHRPFDSIRQCIDHQVRRSLHNLNVEVIDVMQLHGLPDEAIHDEVTQSLVAHVDAGRIRFLGASCGGDAIPRLVDSGAYSTVQLAYNMLDQREREAGLKLAEQHDLGVLIRIPLALGILADKVERLDEQRRQRFSTWLDALRQRLPKGMTVPEAALRFILSAPVVGSTLCGTRRPAHIRENAAAGDGEPLPRDILDWLHGLAARNELPTWSWAEHYERDWPSGANEANLELCRSVDID